ncbi:ExbD/TolR family protein [Parvularcula dongshanensis]|uniref:Biopolymer transport protein ExbD n=1 Tax=Parvularcula dongshanensis TaxID=1173995 RepID=A0A840I300_9PROT|nr:biopolymer transporter ExbD [Parvularcula dongshanensis]MBB4659219.1 biopolymer transport protein ExbD [Parvularcula dongshanensis]
MRRRMSRGEEEADVNMTPLLDIVFIMLIFFIVTATFVYEDGIAPNLPEPNPEENNTEPPPSMLLTVQEDGFVLVDDVRLVDPRSTRPVVEEFLAKEPRGVVIISAAPESETGTTVTVLDQAREAGGPEAYSRITLALQGA